MALLLDDPEAALDRWKWTEKVRTIKGHKWSFEDRDYLWDIYQDESKVIVLKKARQLEMTEFLVNIALYYVCERPNTTVIFSSPRIDQVKRVSKDRVKPAIFTSDYISKQIDSQEIAVESMRFKNGSILYFGSAWGDGDSLRGIPADVVIIDEIQDVSQAAVEAIREGMSHSDLQRLYLVGSPKLAGSEFDMGMWRISDQKEWDVAQKMWVAHPPENRPALYSGYHMFQAMAPWISEKEILEKKETYTEQKFVNEVMGEFYTGGAVKLTIDQLMECTDGDLSYDFDTYVAPAVHYMGIDWGDRNWAVIIDKAGVIKRMVYWDDRADISIVLKLIQQYNVRYTVADMGFGKSEVGRLQSELGYKVWGCQYVDQQQVTFKKGTYRTPDGEEDWRKPVVNANRTDAMDIVYERLYKKGYKFPWTKGARGTTETLFHHMLSPFEEFVPSGHGGLVTKKRYARSGPDHTFHCLVYATIAAMIGGGQLGFNTEDRKDPENVRFHQKDYYVQDRELDSWYDHNAAEEMPF